MAMARRNYNGIDGANQGDQSSRKPIVSVCTSAGPSCVQGLVDEIRRRFVRDSIEDVRYFELPYNNIDSFSFTEAGKDIDVMILCHSINDRRFAITDVEDAIYNVFLAKSVKALGKEKICVIAHDFPASMNLVEQYDNQLGHFKRSQPSTFQSASLVMMTGSLEGAEAQLLQERNWEELRRFFTEAGRAPMKSRSGIEKNTVRAFICLVFVACCIILAIVLGVVLSDSPSNITTALPPTTLPATSPSDNDTTPNPAVNK